MNRPKLILIRGVSGSGKTTLARAMSEATGFRFFEADQWFTTEDGEYVFNPELLRHAHHWCRDMVWKELSNDRSVIVSNTFVRNWEMKPYVQMAHEFNAELVVLECKGNYGSVHNVPEAALQRQRDNWEDFQREERDPYEDCRYERI